MSAGLKDELWEWVSEWDGRKSILMLKYGEKKIGAFLLFKLLLWLFSCCVCMKRDMRYDVIFIKFFILPRIEIIS